MQRHKFLTFYLFIFISMCCAEVLFWDGHYCLWYGGGEIAQPWLKAENKVNQCCLFLGLCSKVLLGCKLAEAGPQVPSSL